MTARHTKFHGWVEGAAARCSVPGCHEPGEYRAPLTPGTFDGPGSWRWLCLEHVRAHNARYNYFKGTSTDEIEAAQSPIAGWERATRAFAVNGADRGPACATSSIRSTPYPRASGQRHGGGRSTASPRPSVMRWR